MFVKNLAALATFAPNKMAKTTIVQGEFLFAGLNNCEPGQEHAPHVHQGQDKYYFILEGNGMVQIADEVQRLSPGDAAFAPSGVIHAIRNPGPGRLVVMTILSPPPR